MKLPTKPLLWTVACVGIACPLLPEPVVPVDSRSGPDPALGSPEGQARAGVVREGGGGLIAGIGSEGGPGDIVLQNARVRLVIETPGVTNGYVDTPGGIIDADIVRPEGVLGLDAVDDVFTSLGAGRLLQADSVTIVNDGTDGAPAVVRAVARDVPWAFVQGAVEGDEPLLSDQNLEVVTEYELEPDAWSVRLTSRFTNVGDEPSRFNVTDGYLAAQEVLVGWAADAGLNADVDDAPAVGFAGRGREATMSLWLPDRDVSSLAIAALVSSAGLNIFSHGWEDLLPGETRVLERFWTVAPDPLTAEADRWARQGVKTRRISGAVEDPDGPVAGVRVHVVTADDRVLGFTHTDDLGRFEARVPEGAVRLVAEALGSEHRVPHPPGRPPAAPYAHASVRAAVEAAGDAPALPRAMGRPVPSAVDAAAGGDVEVVLTIERAGRLRVEVDDGTGPLPAVAEVRREGPAPVAADVTPLAERLGLDLGGRTRVWGVGNLEASLPPGRYTLDVLHSYRHERARDLEVDVGEGESVVPVTLAEVVPRDGRLSIDSHLHAAPSNDSSLTMEDRLLQCAVFGVDVPIPTDHDAIGDYRPLPARLGLDDRMTVVPGVEVSPVLRGHMNLFPVEPATGVQSGGTEPWWEPFGDTSAFVQRMEIRHPGALVQINHPRSGMFDFAGWIPDAGIAAREDFWTDAFDAFELVNSTGAGDLDSLREDWFSFLNLGWLKTPTGVSDSHHLNAPCGYARTDLLVDVESPAGVEADVVVDAVGSGATVVAMGLTVSAELRVGGQAVGPGGVLVGAAGAIDLEVRAPDWIVPERIRVHRNGEVVLTRDVTGPLVDGVWFDDELPVEATEDAWFVVEVFGDTALGGPLGGARPYAAPNAFRLDVGGDGWTPPGIPD